MAGDRDRGTPRLVGPHHRPRQTTPARTGQGSRQRAAGLCHHDPHPAQGSACPDRRQGRHRLRRPVGALAHRPHPRVLAGDRSPRRHRRDRPCVALRRPPHPTRRTHRRVARRSTDPRTPRPPPPGLLARPRPTTARPPDASACTPIADASIVLQRGCADSQTGGGAERSRVRCRPRCAQTPRRPDPAEDRVGVAARRALRQPARRPRHHAPPPSPSTSSNCEPPTWSAPATATTSSTPPATNTSNASPAKSLLHVDHLVNGHHHHQHTHQNGQTTDHVGEPSPPGRAALPPCGRCSLRTTPTARPTRSTPPWRATYLDRPVR